MPSDGGLAVEVAHLDVHRSVGQGDFGLEDSGGVLHRLLEDDDVGLGVNARANEGSFDRWSHATLWTAGSGRGFGNLGSGISDLGAMGFWLLALGFRL